MRYLRSFPRLQLLPYGDRTYTTPRGATVPASKPQKGNDRGSVGADSSPHTIVTNAAAIGWPHPVYVSDKIRDRRSTFLAHASALPMASDLSCFLAYLTSSSALKRATHCMYAYRTSSQDGKIIMGQHDGREGGSGDRLARLLDLSGCHHTIVVVSRWYGGVQLGSDRWKRISTVAKEALERGGFTKANSKPQGKK